MMYQHFKPLTKIYKEVYKHCFFKLENSEKTVVFSMDATFDSDFLNIFTSLFSSAVKERWGLSRTESVLIFKIGEREPIWKLLVVAEFDNRALQI